MWPGSRTGTTSRPGPGPHLWTPPPGEQIRHRLSRAGNRRLNHVLHMATIAQIRLDTEGRTYYRRKLAEAKTRKEARRCLKRRLSDMVYRQLVADANLIENAGALASARGVEAGPGGQSGASTEPSAADLCPPVVGSSDQPHPEPAAATLPAPRRPRTPPAGSAPQPPRRRAGAVNVERPAGRTTLTATGTRRTLKGAETPLLTTEGNRKEAGIRQLGVEPICSLDA